MYQRYFHLVPFKGEQVKINGSEKESGPNRKSCIGISWKGCHGANLKQVWMAAWLQIACTLLPWFPICPNFPLFFTLETQIYRSQVAQFQKCSMNVFCKRTVGKACKVEMMKFWRRISIKLPLAWISEILRQPGDPFKWGDCPDQKENSTHIIYIPQYTIIPPYPTINHNRYRYIIQPKASTSSWPQDFCLGHSAFVCAITPPKRIIFWKNFKHPLVGFWQN